MDKSKITSLLNRIAKDIFPQNRYLKLLNFKRGFIEPELKLIPLLCDRTMIAIDVGAYDGLYTSHMYLNSKQCYAFEPRKSSAEKLITIFNKMSPPIVIEQVALSDHQGITKLKVFLDEVGRSTIESENKIEEFGKVEVVEVTVRRLDDYQFNSRVGLIKIDVEGHEEAVLKGAEKLLSKEEPSLIIEIENRHKQNAVSKIQTFLNSFDYKGYYMINNKLHSIKEFIPEIHQNVNHVGNRQKYINNFVFVAQSAMSKIKPLIV